MSGKEKNARPKGKAKKAVPKAELEVLEFSSAAAWRDWLVENHTCETGIWLRFARKGSGVTSITYPEALDEALCFGWIDGQAKSLDERSYLQRFTPRRPRSIWSKRNIEHVERLTAAGRMNSAGLRQVELARADGRWAAAYDPPSKMEMPAEFLQLLQSHPKAAAFYETLNKTNRYAIAWRFQTAKKPETRARRTEAIIAMLAAGKKFH